jgi:hypothetical protein
MEEIAALGEPKRD